MQKKEGFDFMKYSFRSDYCELAHPEILKAFYDVGNKQFTGYGLDEFSQRASDLIREKIKAPAADVHFISGGTHANLCVISSMLRPYEAIIAPETGHILLKVLEICYPLLYSVL